MLACALVLTSALAAGCASTSGAAPADPAPKPAASEPGPKPTSWVVSIVDEDSYSQGAMTYTVAVDMTATNPSSDPVGKYTGSAAAKTTTAGTVNGLPLNASASVKSTSYGFALKDLTGGGKLAPLTPDDPAYLGAGSVVMRASGSGSIGAAGGGFSNTSGQPFTITVNGSDQATLKIAIQGHTYTFHGTMSGK